MFSKKEIRVVIYKREQTGTQEFNFVNLPIEVKINKAILPAGSSAMINIYGISKDKMDAITTIAWKTGFIDNKDLIIFANDGDGEHVLFSGKVMSAFPNYNNAPDICISINACAGAYYNLVTDVPPSSIREGAEVPVHQVFAEICKQYNMNFENRGVFSVCKYPRTEGHGLADRLYKAARAYNVNVVIEGNNVTIWPKDSYLYTAQQLTLTSKDYIGYPSFNTTGIDIKLDRLLRSLRLGDFFTIAGSDVSAANDRWSVIKIVFDISTKIGGKWEMDVSAVRVGL